jgi:hypothetical protein
MIEWLEAHMGTCAFVSQFNMECPGCGSQRAIIALLKGDLVQSLKLYPALIPYLSTLIIMIAHLIFKFRNGAQILVWSFIFSAGLMIVSYVIKLIA